MFWDNADLRIYRKIHCDVPYNSNVFAWVSGRQIQADVHEGGPVDPEELEDEGGELLLGVRVALEHCQVRGRPKELSEVWVDEINSWKSKVNLKNFP